MSMRATSGLSARICSTASCPSTASPTTSMSGSASRIILKPARTSAWSSAISTRINVPPAPRAVWRARRSLHPFCTRLRSPPEHRNAFAHAHEALAGHGAIRGMSRDATPIVAYVDLHVMLAVSDGHLGARGPGVLERVPERLLDDPEGRQVDARLEPALLPLDRQVDLEPGLAGALHEPVELVHARLRRERQRLLGVVPEHADHAAHLLERGPAGLLHAAERVLCLRRVVVDHPARGGRLHDHHAHVVGHHVVQLASDPGALVGYRQLSLLLLLALEPVGLVAQLHRELPARRHDPAHEPGPEHEQRGEEEVAALAVVL